MMMMMIMDYAWLMLVNVLSGVALDMSNLV